MLFVVGLTAILFFDERRNSHPLCWWVGWGGGWCDTRLSARHTPTQSHSLSYRPRDVIADTGGF